MRFKHEEVQTWNKWDNSWTSWKVFCGFDELSAGTLKCVAEEIAQPFFLLVNIWLEQGSFQDSGIYERLAYKYNELETQNTYRYDLKQHKNKKDFMNTQTIQVTRNEESLIIVNFTMSLLTDIIKSKHEFLLNHPVKQLLIF